MLFTKKLPPVGYYVYAYLRIDGTPYYIGKGYYRRAWSFHTHIISVPADNNRIVICEQALTDLLFPRSCWMRIYCKRSTQNIL